MDQRIHAAEDTVQLSSIVERVEWQPGAASIHVWSALDGSRHELRSRRVIVTIPLVVLQARPDCEGAIQFVPEPREALEAARSLAFGNVFRVTLRFHKAFGKVIEKLSETGFLFSQNPSFPTWWTPNPVWAPVLTGWSAGQRPTRFIGMSRSEIVASALSSLQQILGMPALEPRAAYFHDWQADPFT
jgi:monoamine oxidase